MKELTVAEIFGPTYQGEGPTLGRRAMFLRLGLCNLACTWCDTPYTWDWLGKNGEPQDKGKLKRYDVEEVARAVGNRERLLVITGGEPMLQQSGIVALLDGLLDQDVEIETNGTLAPGEALRHDSRVRFNVSPKLSHAQADTINTAPINLEVLRDFAALSRWGRASFKFVANSTHIADDLDEITAICNDAGISAHHVWVMPEGRTAAQITARTMAIADAVLERGFNLTTRLHVLAWGDERGR